VVEALDLGEGGLQTILRSLLEKGFAGKARKLRDEKTYPLSLILLPAPGYRDGVFKHAVVFPQLQLLERWSTSKEIENGANEGLLMRIKRHARSGLDVGGLGLDGGRHAARLDS